MDISPLCENGFSSINTAARYNGVAHPAGTNKRGIRFQMGFKLMLRLCAAENLKAIWYLKGRGAAPRLRFSIRLMTLRSSPKLS